MSQRSQVTTSCASEEPDSFGHADLLPRFSDTASSHPCPTIDLKPSRDLLDIRSFVAERITASRERDWASEEHRLAILRDLHARGVLQAGVPRELGGGGATMIELLWLARELAYGSLGVATSTMINVLALTVIALFARPALRRSLCRRSSEDFALWSYCMTEPEAGSDLDSLRTLARRVEGGFVLTGRKCFITNGSISNHLVVYAALERPPSRMRRISAFYVPGDSSGLRRGGQHATLGLAGSDTADVFLDDVFVPEEHLLGEEGGGLEVNTRCLQRSKALIAGAAVGVCARAFDLTVEYLSQRVLYRRPLLRQPTIRHHLAQIWTEVEASWLLACSAGAAWDTGQPSVRQASMAKMFAADTAVKCTGELLELFGGRGYLKDFEMERLYRDAKILEIYEGPTFIQQLLIAEAILSSPPDTPAGEREAR